tara:strand:- start:18735 stop:19373 length:639 start_codon:yes stop_codon:yes gene_type:complete
MRFDVVSWKLHIGLVRLGKRASLRQGLVSRIFRALKDQEFVTEENFDSGGGSHITDILVDQYFENLTGTQAKILESMDAMNELDKNEGDEKRLFHLQTEFLKMAEQHAIDYAREALAQGIDVNFQDPRTGMTAMHFAACGDKAFVQMLDDTGEVDYLIYDKHRRLAYSMASEFSNERELARDILDKTDRQAREAGYESFVDFHRANYQPQPN